VCVCYGSTGTADANRARVRGRADDATDQQLCVCYGPTGRGTCVCVTGLRGRRTHTGTRVCYGSTGRGTRPDVASVCPPATIAGGETAARRAVTSRHTLVDPTSRSVAKNGPGSVGYLRADRSPATRRNVAATRKCGALLMRDPALSLAGSHAVERVFWRSGSARVELRRAPLAAARRQLTCAPAARPWRSLGR